MRLLYLMPLTLITACASTPTELEPISHQCQQQLDAYRDQPALRDSRGARPPLPIAPISDTWRQELSRKGNSLDDRR